MLQAILAIALSRVLVYADVLTNSSTNPVVRIGAYSVMRDSNGNYKFVNPNEFWDGVWKENTNGWRVQLKTDAHPWFPQQKLGDTMLSVELGSATTNSADSGGGYCHTPDNKFAKFELVDAHGNIVRPRPGVGTNLFGHLYVFGHGSGGIVGGATTWHSDVNSLEEKYPETISTNAYIQMPLGGFVGGMVSFTSDFPPYRLNALDLNELYLITNQGDYTLTVCPVVYKRRFGTDYSRGILDRVDLPCVTIKVHLNSREK